MTAVENAASTEEPRTPQELHGPGTWRVGLAGVRTVAGLELRQRVRSSRWKIVLALWAALLLGLTVLLHLTLGTIASDDETQSSSAGAVMFGVIVYAVLSLGSLIAPGLSATSVNGDRAAGVLATLQTTLLTPAEIVLGKLAAAWVTSLAFLAIALPFIVWGYLTGGTPLGRLAVTLTLLAVMLLVVCAIGLGWSSLTARTASSVVLTYLTVAFMGVGLPVLFGLSLVLVTSDDTTATLEPIPAATTAPDATVPQVEPLRCVPWRTTVTHTERTWWLLAANPYVVLGDASPRPAGARDEDPLSVVRSGVRVARLGSAGVCVPGRVYSSWDEADAEQERRRESLGVTWPYGLAINVLLGVAGTVVAIRRLRTPVRSLPRGTRIA